LRRITTHKGELSGWGSLLAVRSALVTGASTGIGRATVLRLDRAGWRVFAGVRKEEDAEALRAEGSERLTPVTLDVASSEAISAAAELLPAELGSAGLDGLVNNAGIGVPSPLETIPIDDFRRQIEVNLISQVAVTQAVLPLIRLAQGRVVFVSSIGGRIAFPIGGAYHAAKFGIEAVGDVFRQELQGWGISVSIIEPGSIDTEIWRRSEREVDAMEEGAATREELYGKAIAGYRKLTRSLAERGIHPDKVAKAIEHALSAGRPRVRYLVGFDAKAQVRARPLVPTRIWDRIVARAMGL
jgi:NAD(P)-dependent dehydrogenase (short-subunit alcohol dehydrogenase family)